MLYNIKVLFIFISVCLSAPVYADAKFAKIEFSKELISCATYYQISSEALVSMSSPQMQEVGKKLKLSASVLVYLARKLRPEMDFLPQLDEAREEQIGLMMHTKSLNGLRGKYQSLCQDILENPGKRFNYWMMATI